jgi:hypothetical protein
VPLRESIAHAATPWEWRSRAAVVGLVVATIAVPVAFIADALSGGDGRIRLVLVLWYGGFGSLLMVRPAIQSLRRWDKCHAGGPDGS